MRTSRRGNLWTATSNGIDCFRDVRVVTFFAREGVSMEVDAVLTSGDGTVWIGGDEGWRLFIRAMCFYSERKWLAWASKLHHCSKIMRARYGSAYITRCRLRKILDIHLSFVNMKIVI